MKKLLPVIALAIFAVLGGTWFLTQSSNPSDPILGSALAQEAGEIDTSTVAEMILGNPDAAVEVIEYASFTCPHCAAFHANQFQELKANYIDTGLIKFVYREIYFDRFGLWASMVARCGGEMRFFGISDMLYDQQREWIAGGQDPALIAGNLRRIGLTAGLDGEQVDACLSDPTTAQTLVAWFEENSARDEITSTPSFVIDGEKFSNMSYSDFAAVLDERLAAK
ncbi:MAG: DsbA family protein [Flavimaricola sp.]|nr:DsbA family protein [Flavimaricola sp.]